MDYHCVFQVKERSGAVQLLVTAYLIKCFLYLGFFLDTVFPTSGRLKIKYIKNLWYMNTLRDVIKFGISYYHFEVSCKVKSGSPTFPKFEFRC